MIKKIKEYLEYRRNKKLVKKEIAKIGASILPIVSNASTVGKDVIMFVTKLANESNKIEGEQFIEMILSELSKMLQTDNERILQIITYIAQLSPRDIQNIITNAAVNTMDS